MDYGSAAPSPCAGRDGELARLAELYRDALQHGNQLALLRGPSGVGKSRILQEFRSRVRLEGGVVLEGRCEPGHAFGPFAEIVDRALRFLDEVGVRPSIDVHDLACLEGCHRFWYQHSGCSGDGAAVPVNPGTSEAAEKRLRFFEAIDGLLRDVARVRAPVVMLHDLERADQGTLHLVHFVLDGAGPWTDGTNHASSLEALLVASVRSDAPVVDDAALDALHAHSRTIHVDVDRLDEQGVRAYLQSSEIVTRVLERTGGMPEAIELLLDAEPLSPEAQIERQLEGLSRPARQLIEALAVVQQPADVELLARIAEVSLDRQAHAAFGQSPLVTHSILDGRMLFAFARESTRERAYALIPAERRRQLHVRCAQVFRNEPGRAQEAAHHALRAGDYERAFPLAMEAAHSLTARHAHGEAAALLEQVAEGAPDAVPLEVRAYLAELYRIAGEYRRALQHAQAIWRRCPESATAARRAGDLLTLAGQLDEAAATLEDAHRLAKAAADPTARGEVEALLAELHYQRASYTEARQWAEHALGAAEQLEQLPLALHARNTLGKLALAQQDAGTAIEHFEHNRRKAQEAELGHQQAQALTNLGVAMLRRQDLAGAEDAFSRAIDVASSANDTRDRAIAIENLAVLAHLGRDYERALRQYHEAVALLKRLGNRPMLTRVANNLGELYLSLGDRSRARALCDFAAQVGGAGLPPSVAGEGLLLRGRVEAANGNTAAAVAAVEAALQTFERLGHARVTDALLERARVALADGDVACARDALARLPEPESPKQTAEVALVAADVERAAGGDTLRAAQRAVDRAEAAEDEELLLPALVRLARARCDESDLAGASGVLERAQQIEQGLTDRVPEEAKQSWLQRPARAELAAAEAQLAGAWRAGERESTLPRPRISSTPPPSRSHGDHDAKLATWRQRYPELVGSSAAAHNLLSLLDKVAPTDALVLVRGESGTGKELIAEALHANSSRRDRPLVKVNCAALVETLLLSELFGHERGAFTGANARRKGRFELADGGTIFLDEIGDISPKTQVALLRVLQEREFERVGGTQSIKVDVRIIAATHRDLEKMVHEGTFREDLYYRLRGVMVEMPPLRRRMHDIGELSDHLLRRIAAERDEPPKQVSAEALELLHRHRWPGNVRELENVLRSATLFAEGEVLVPEDFAPFTEAFQPPQGGEEAAGPDPQPAADSHRPLEDGFYERVRGGEGSLLEMKKELERECIMRALSETDGNITRAASLLGMKRPRLSQLVKQYGLQARAERAER